MNKLITYICKLIKKLIIKMISIIKSPNNYEPAYQHNILYILDSDNKHLINFKYGFNLNTKRALYDEWEFAHKSYGYPRADGFGIYTPHNILQDFLTYDNNFDTIIPVACTNSALFYEVEFLESSKPNLYFLDIISTLIETYSTDWENDGFDIWTTNNVEITNLFGTYVVNKVDNSSILGIITTNFNLIAGELYEIEVKYGLEAFKDGEIRMLLNSSPQIWTTTGLQTVKYQFISTGDDLISFQIVSYDNDNNFIEHIKIFKDEKALDFGTESANILQVGDEIRIDLYNKMVNPQYNGEFIVLGISDQYAILDLPTGDVINFTQPGEVTIINRSEGLSDSKIAFNGLRNYEQLNFDFQDNYVINNDKKYKYLTVYQQPRNIRLYENETLSILKRTDTDVDYSLTVTYYFYDKDGNSLGDTRESLTDYDGDFYPRLDIPSGTYNLNQKFSWFEDIVDDLDHYTVNIIDSTYPELVDWTPQAIPNSDFSEGLDGYVAWSDDGNFTTRVREGKNVGMFDELEIGSTFHHIDFNSLGIESGEFKFNINFFKSGNAIVNLLLYADDNLVEEIPLDNDGHQTITLQTQVIDNYRIIFTGFPGSYIDNFHIDGYTVERGIYEDKILVEKKYIIDRECNQFEPIRVMWLNDLGGMEYYTFNERTKYNIEAERKIITRNLPVEYKIGDFQRDVVGASYRQIVELSTNFMSEDEVVLLESLFRSSKIWIIKEIDNIRYTIPYIHIDNNFSILDYNDDKISYLVRLEKSSISNTNI